MGIRGEADSSASEDVADLGSSAGKADESLDQLTQAFSEAASTLRGDAQQADEPTYAATGGHIRGAGTSTSDSIPAMLSDEEYVLNANAAKRVGIKNLDAINFGGKGLHHFAIGGPVGFMGSVGIPDIQSPSIAAMGGNEPLHPVTIAMPDGRSVGGLRAPRDVVDDLQKASVMAQLARTGPSPSWSGA